MLRGQALLTETGSPPAPPGPALSEMVMGRREETLLSTAPVPLCLLRYAPHTCVTIPRRGRGAVPGMQGLSGQISFYYAP